MKRSTTLFSIALLSLLVLVYFSSLKGTTDTPSKTVDNSDFFEIFQEDCQLYSPENNDFTYKNNSTGLNLHYPEDTIVCEKQNSLEEESSMDVMVWNRRDFEEMTPSLPLAIIYFDNHLIDSLPQSNIISTEEITIGDETISVDIVKAPECSNDSCLTYQTTSFIKDGHTIKIEILSDKISWNDFYFE